VWPLTPETVQMSLLNKNA